MKRNRLKLSFIVGICLLLFIFPALVGWKSSSLKDITKLYLGTYECQEARLNEKDILHDFDYIRLELKKKGKCVLYYAPKEGAKKREEGNFTYDKKNKSITLQGDNFPFFKREFPLDKGELHITLPIGNRTLYLRFEQK